VVNFVTKGSNVWTEHYSAVAADVVDPSDPSTQLNTDFVKVLMEADTIAIAGEASSHCVKNTVEGVADAFGDDNLISKLVLLKDATSPVPGFENLEEKFIKEMTARGMRVSTTVDFLR
jgi:nicotinamidase-related amidase